jgi:hypothetical protein
MFHGLFGRTMASQIRSHLHRLVPRCPYPRTLRTQTHYPSPPVLRVLPAAPIPACPSGPSAFRTPLKSCSSLAIYPVTLASSDKPTPLRHLSGPLSCLELAHVLFVLPSLSFKYRLLSATIVTKNRPLHSLYRQNHSNNGPVRRHVCHEQRQDSFSNSTDGHLG